MSRIPYLREDEMSLRQREINATFVAERGEPVRGPVAFWMRNVELGLRHQKVRLKMERATSFPRAQSEIPILAANRHWSAEFTWCRHERAATHSGTEAAPISAMREGRRVTFSDPAAQALYNFSRELLETTGVSDETYRRVLDLFGLAATIELVGLVAYGTILSISANTFGPEELEPSDCTLPPMGPPPSRPTRRAQEARLGGIGSAAGLDPACGAAADAASIWRRADNMAQPWEDYEAVIRSDCSVPTEIRELVTLRVAQYWRCGVQWSRHQPLARAAGIAPTAIAALAAGARGADLPAGPQTLALAFAEALLVEGIASDTLQDRAIDELGTNTVIELVAVVGLQTLVAMTLNTFGRGNPDDPALGRVAP